MNCFEEFKKQNTAALRDRVLFFSFAVVFLFAVIFQNLLGKIILVFFLPLFAKVSHKHKNEENIGKEMKFSLPCNEAQREINDAVNIF